MRRAAVLVLAVTACDAGEHDDFMAPGATGKGDAATQGDAKDGYGGCVLGQLVITEPVLKGDVVWDQCEVHLMLRRTTIGGTLTIAPGVHVFGQYDWDATQLTVAGTLIARGNPDAPIVFAAGGEQAWGGLVTQSHPTARIELEYVEIRDAILGVGASHGHIQAHHTLIEGRGVGSGVVVGSVLNDAQIELDDVLVRGFETGISGGALGGTASIVPRITVRDSVITQNNRGVFVGTRYSYCTSATPAKPVGRLVIEDSDIVDNGLAFGIGYDTPWVWFQLDRLNITGNDEFALYQPYGVPAVSFVRNSNIVDNGSGVESSQQRDVLYFSSNYWGGLTQSDLLAAAEISCTDETAEDLLSFGDVRTEPLEVTGPQNPMPWAVLR